MKALRCSSVVQVARFALLLTAVSAACGCASQATGNGGAAAAPGGGTAAAPRGGTTEAPGGGGTSEGTAGGGVAGNAVPSGGLAGNGVAGDGLAGGGVTGRGGVAGGGVTGVGAAGTSKAGSAAGIGGMGTGTGGVMFDRDPVVYVGGYDPVVRSYRLNRMTGALTPLGAGVNLGKDPSFLAVNPARTHLYAANESDDAQGGVTAAAIGADGVLTRMGHRSADNLGFCHITVAPDGRHLLAASYNGGVAAVFSVAANGDVGALVDTERFAGNPVRTHSTTFSRSGRHVFIANLGLNQVAQFTFDAASGALTPNTPASVASASGAGPRHMAVHPTLPIAYAMNELNSTVTAYTIGAAGTLTTLETKSTLPASFSGTNSGAHIAVSPDGKLLFASNRGHNSIVVFSVNASTGALSLLEHEPTRGATPRNFDVDPAGKYLIVANQGSDSLAVFSIHASGLTPVGDVVTGSNNPSAVQIVYLP